MGDKHRVVSEQVKKWKTGTGDKYTTCANNAERPRSAGSDALPKLKSRPEKKRMIK